MLIFAISPEFFTDNFMDFNKWVQEDERVENVLLPVRDGLLVMRKK